MTGHAISVQSPLVLLCAVVPMCENPFRQNEDNQGWSFRSNLITTGFFREIQIDPQHTLAASHPRFRGIRSNLPLVDFDPSAFVSGEIDCGADESDDDKDHAYHGRYDET